MCKPPWVAPWPHRAPHVAQPFAPLLPPTRTCAAPSRSTQALDKPACLQRHHCRRRRCPPASLHSGPFTKTMDASQLFNRVLGRHTDSGGVEFWRQPERSGWLMKQGD